MGDFFKGWRRKTGLLLLVMAMPISMAWLRSFHVIDGVSLSLGIRCDMIQSFDGTLCWKRTNPRHNNVSIERYSDGIVRRKSAARWSNVDVERRWRWLGFDFGATTQYESWSPSYCEFWVIPYWSLVMPPTFLSAYLLLIKPRAVKRPVTNQDAARAGD